MRNWCNMSPMTMVMRIAMATIAQLYRVSLVAETTTTKVTSTVSLARNRWNSAIGQTVMSDRAINTRM